MSADWQAILKKVCPRGKSEILAGVAESMPEACKIADLNTPLRVQHFLAQIAHESAGFLTTTEYASGAAYEGRRDLGNTQAGDGKRFRGRGVIQLTGRSNYKIYGDKLGVDLVSDPLKAAAFPYAVMTAALYWKERKLNTYADQDDIRGVTKRVNGGYNGLADRENYLTKAKNCCTALPAAAPPEPEVAYAYPDQWQQQAQSTDIDDNAFIDALERNEEAFIAMLIHAIETNDGVRDAIYAHFDMGSEEEEDAA